MSGHTVYYRLTGKKRRGKCVNLAEIYADTGHNATSVGLCEACDSGLKRVRVAILLCCRSRIPLVKQMIWKTRYQNSNYPRSIVGDKCNSGDLEWTVLDLENTSRTKVAGLGVELYCSFLDLIAGRRQ